jgi:hypothetical protein
MLVGDPSSGYSFKCTVTDIANIIETDIGDAYVTLTTTQTISGVKTFSNNLTLTSVTNASVDTDKFLVLSALNVVTFRTGSEVLSDIGAQGTITLTTTGTSGAATFSSNTLNIPQYQGALTLTTTGTSGAATLVGNTLNIPNYAPDLSGYVPTSRTITINGVSQDLSANRTYNVGTVTSVAATAGTGISISGSPITSSGTLTITNTAPDQVVALTAGTGISISGTYPNFTITNISPSLGGTVTSVALSAPTGFSVTGSPVTTSGTLGLTFATGYSLPTTASQVNWDAAYNDKINSVSVSGTTTKTLTLTQQDGGTLSTSWTDDNTDAVTSVFGRTGAVVATEGDYSLTQLSDVTITTPTNGQVLKYNGTTWINDTDANTGTVTSVALSVPTGLSVSGSPITSSGTLAVTFASGYSIPTTASQANWDTAYTNRITSLTTTGSSGAATLISNTLNIPNYTLSALGGVPTTRTLTINGTALDLSVDRSWSVGTVTSVAATAGTGISISGSPITSSGTLTITNTAPDQVVALTAGTGISTSGTYPNFTITNSAPDQTVSLTAGSNITITGTYPNFTIAASGGGGTGTVTSVGLSSTTSGITIGSTPITTSGTITLDIATASGSQQGLLSSTDWTTFNNKQNALTNPVTGTGTTNYIPKFTSSSAIGNSQVFDNGTNVGIGTTSPAALLHVSQASANTIFRLGNNTTYDQFIYFNGNNDWSLGMDYSNSNAFVLSNASSLGTNDRLVITTGGNVGIGTTSPNAKLQVLGTIKVATGNAQGILGLGEANGATVNVGIWRGAANAPTSDGNFLNLGGYDGMVFAVSAAAIGSQTERMRITSGGSVGIGTTSPLGNLDVSTSGNTAINITAGSTALSRLIFGTTSGNSRGFIDYDNTSSVRAMIFRTNESERMRITSGGNIGIGTTTIGSTLQVNGNAAIGYSASTAAPTNGLQVAGAINSGGNITASGTGNMTINVQSSNNFPLLQMTDTRSGTIAWNIENGRAGSGVLGLFYSPLNLTRLAIDGPNAIVYVGNGEVTASPTTAIISGTGGSGTNIAGAEFRIRGGASTGNAAGGPITFYTSAAGSSGSGVNAATERMRIGSNIEVGTGANDPLNATFVVAGNVGTGQGAANTTVQINIWETTSANKAGLWFGAMTNENTGVIGSRTATGNIAFQTFSGSWAERMRLTNTGNLGIGTTTIGSRLQVNGGAAIGYSASTAAPTNGLAVSGSVGMGLSAVNVELALYRETLVRMHLQNSTSGTTSTDGLQLSLNGSDGYLWNFENGSTIFGTNNTERMRITNGGQVTLSTGSNVSAIAQTGYSLTGSNASSLLDLAGTWNTTGNPTAIKLNITNTASGATADLMELQVGGTSQFTVDKSGNTIMTGSVKTGAPTGGTAATWKLGSKISNTMAFDDSGYLEVEVGGTTYYVALCFPA